MRIAENDLDDDKEKIHDALVDQTHLFQVFEINLVACSIFIV
jgi:hypothetical protein